MELKYQQPFSLDVAKELTDVEIDKEITRLNNSVHHLKRTNDELLNYLPKQSNTDNVEGSFDDQVIKPPNRISTEEADLIDQNSGDIEMLLQVRKENEYTMLVIYWFT